MKNIWMLALATNMVLGNTTEAVCAHAHSIQHTPRPEESEVCRNFFAPASPAPQSVPCIQPMERNPGWLFWMCLMGGIGVWLGHQIIHKKQQIMKERKEKMTFHMQSIEEMVSSMVKRKNEQARQKLQKELCAPLKNSVQAFVAKGCIKHADDAPFHENLLEEGFLASPVEFFSSLDGKSCSFSIRDADGNDAKLYAISPKDLIHLQNLEKQRWSALCSAQQHLRAQHEEGQKKIATRALWHHALEYIKLSDALACAHIEHKKR